MIDKTYLFSSVQCSSPCDGGNQRRTVKCVRPIGAAMKESDGCKFVDRKPIFQSCNSHACTDDLPAALTDMEQNDTDPGELKLKSLIVTFIT